MMMHDSVFQANECNMRAGYQTGDLISSDFPGFINSLSLQTYDNTMKGAEGERTKRKEVKESAG